MVSKALTIPFWTFSAVGAVYAIFIGLLTSPRLQRNALYANNLHTAWWNDISKPESFGFAKNQVTPLNITTPDGETLFAWHVLPLGLYAQHQKALAAQPSNVAFEDSLSYKLLRDDPKARLVVSFHGNAGHIAEGQRPNSLHTLASLPPSPSGPVNTHVLTFDYRGFGVSTGTPTEQGLITDALTVLATARNLLNIPPARTVLLGTSLGTAVVAGSMDALLNSTRPADADFVGIVITSGFDSLPNLLKTYAIGGIVPILSPLSGYPILQSWLTSTLADTWLSAQRWTRVLAHARGSTGTGLRVHIVHAKDDHEIRWQHSDLLYEGCVRGLGGDEAAAQAKGEVGHVLSERAGWQSGAKGSAQSGRFERVFAAPGGEVRQTVVEWGGHNKLLGYAPVLLAVWDMFNGGGGAGGK